MESSFAGSMEPVFLGSTHPAMFGLHLVCLSTELLLKLQQLARPSQIILTMVLYGFSMGFSFHKWADLVTY